MNTNTIPGIEVHDSLAEYLGGPKEIENFTISIFDAAKLAGHLCPSVAGAFLVTRAAVLALFPDTKVCERGLLRIDIPGACDEGANGPISHVMSYITGAWPESGFAGLQGEFVRRNLLHFNSEKVANGKYRFERTDNGKTVEVTYDPSKADFSGVESMEFAKMWQERVGVILDSLEVIKIRFIN